MQLLVVTINTWALSGVWASLRSARPRARIGNVGSPRETSGELYLVATEGWNQDVEAGWLEGLPCRWGLVVPLNALHM